MSASPDHHVAPDPDRRDYAVRTIWPMSSQLLIANHIYTARVRTAAIYLDSPALGGTWTPAIPKPNITAPIAAMKAWCAFLNSTCGNLLLLNARAKKLTYSTYKPAQLSALPLPNPMVADVSNLARVYEEAKSLELQPWSLMNEDSVRQHLDDAVAKYLGLNSTVVADWRERLVREPTISNKPATTDLEDSPSGFISRLLEGPSLDGIEIERDRSPMRDAKL